MEKLEVKYRTWFKGIGPRPIRLDIPGWAGDSHGHSDGDRPQPWHCPPFVDGSTYGLELIYPFDTECHVRMVDGEIRYEGDFTEENKGCPGTPLPPFMSFAPGHFGMTSSLDIKVPTGYVLRLETHPRFYTDPTGTVPCALPGHLQTEWWPKIFFVVFKNPMPGQTIIFRKGEPYAQALIVPRCVSYDIREMTKAEATERAWIDSKIDKYYKSFVKNDWKDYKGYNFTDRYKLLASAYAKGGAKGVLDFLEEVANGVVKDYKPKLVMRKKNDESVSDKEEGD